MHIYMYIYMHIYFYIFKKKERERERARDRQLQTNYVELRDAQTVRGGRGTRFSKEGGCEQADKEWSSLQYSAEWCVWPRIGEWAP